MAVSRTVRRLAHYDGNPDHVGASGYTATGIRTE
jgi:hypothetical protein